MIVHLPFSTLGEVLTPLMSDMERQANEERLTQLRELLMQMAVTAENASHSDLRVGSNDELRACQEMERVGSDLAHDTENRAAAEAAGTFWFLPIYLRDPEPSLRTAIELLAQQQGEAAFPQGATLLDLAAVMMELCPMIPFPDEAWEVVKERAQAVCLIACYSAPPLSPEELQRRMNGVMPN